MGYCYGHNPRTGRDVLACDNCSTVGGVRRRTCPRKVLTDSLRSTDGSRHETPYCSAPALCDGCWRAKGRTAGVHANCAAGAAASQARDDEIEALLDAGHLLVVAAAGSWRTDVPAGQTLVTFRGRNRQVDALVNADTYDPTLRPRLDHYPDATIVTDDPTRGCGKARRTPAETRALVATLTNGTEIRFDQPVEFTDGVTEDRFVVDGKSLRRSTDHRSVNLRGWRTSHRWIVAPVTAATAA